MTGFTFFVLVIVLFVVAKRGIQIVQQATVKIVERLGKFHKIAHSGINFIWPFVDSVRPFVLSGRRSPHVDMREQVIDFPPQPVITRDNVTMEVDTVLYFQITDPFKAIYEIVDLGAAIHQLTVTSLRNVMGELALDDTLTSRETVNAKLRNVLDEATDKWGVKVNRVELKNIEPPKEIRDAHGHADEGGARTAGRGHRGGRHQEVSHPECRRAAGGRHCQSRRREARHHPGCGRRSRSAAENRSGRS